MTNSKLLKIKTPKISKREFINRLKKRKYENIDAIKLIENYLVKKRNYIFKMPKRGSSVILLVSGGLDSTVVWGILLKFYQLKVYPLFLHRGYKRWKKEKRAIDFFSKYYQRKFPHLFVSPQEYSTDLPPREIEENMRNARKYLHPVKILESLDLTSRIASFYSLGILPYLFPHFGVAYGKYLEDHKNILIRTIFSSVCVGDGSVVPSQTFTALRSTMLDMCLATADFSWEFTSFAMEKEIGHYLEKVDLIKIGEGLGLPLEKTWSCYLDKKYQCGECLTCLSRRKNFSKAGMTDKTKYASEFSFSAKFFKIKELIKMQLLRRPLTRRLLKSYFKLKDK